MKNNFSTIAAQLIDAGRALHALGMVPATSGNFSALLDDGNIAITVSGKHKGKLVEQDIMVLRPDGSALDQRRPSAETGLHLQLYRRFPDVRAILHPHSRAATMLAHVPRDRIVLRGYELLKAFSGISTHQTSISIPVFDNDQDIARLASVVDACMESNAPVHAYIIRGHGFYCWADSVDAALRHCEALEFLLQCEFKISGLVR
jgi:methylthioribulose-1-phosphate dehydratase